MDYWICEDKPRHGRKDYKTVHALGACKSIEDAREAAQIWIHLMRQQNRRALREGSGVPRFPFPGLAILDEEGNVYPLQEYDRYDGWGLVQG